jgi:hypothetical protein
MSISGRDCLSSTQEIRPVRARSWTSTRVPYPEYSRANGPCASYPEHSRDNGLAFRTPNTFEIMARGGPVQDRLGPRPLTRRQPTPPFCRNTTLEHHLIAHHALKKQQHVASPNPVEIMARGGPVQDPGPPTRRQPSLDSPSCRGPTLEHHLFEHNTVKKYNTWLYPKNNNLWRFRGSLAFKAHRLLYH